MLQAPQPKNEEDRLMALQALSLLDTAPEPTFDAIVQLARSLFQAPICLVSLVDAQRQWFKARLGVSVDETPRDISFCGHAICGDDVFVVLDATADLRFADNPLVTGPTGIRFYAGAPLRLASGHAIGTLCVIDTEPRTAFSAEDRARLSSIAAICLQVIVSRAEAAQTRRLLDKLPMGVMLRSFDGVVTDANPALAGMLRRSQESLRGADWRRIAVDQAEEQDEALVELAKSAGSFGPYDVELLRADGVRVPTQIRGLLVERGAAAELLCVIEDITVRRRNEYELVQAQKMEAIGQLTGGLAHDFNNMLGVIIGNLDLMERDLRRTHPARGKMETARTAALRGADLTRALLSIARRQTLTHEPVELNTRITELLPLVRHTVGAAIEVIVDLDDAPVVDVDSGGLASAILNLVINARDAMPDGGRITLKTRVRPVFYDDAENDIPPGLYVALSVSDTGVGMSPDVLARAAHPFFTTKDKGHGTGLGLAMAMGFAKQSRGDFRMYSEVGHGTSATFLLPLAARGAAQVEPLSAPHGLGERVLVVDDEVELLAVTATWLKDLGYRVTPCASPRSALNALSEAVADGGAFDLLVTDVIMPGMNGFALAIACREIQPKLSLLYVSGFADAADRSVLRLEGELVQKPFRQNELAAAAHRALGVQGVEASWIE